MPNPAAESDQKSRDPTYQEDKVITKFIVAVHGIGDQTEFGTIKSAAFRCFSYRGAPADIPLGSFHTAHLNDVGAPSLDVPIDDSHKIRLRFAEVYWAAVPRDLVKQGFTLEEAKHRAQTVVERFRARYDRKQEEHDPKHKEKGANGSQTTLTRDDFSKVKQILLEMIESIRIVERLVMLAEKAGLFKFNLGKLLDDYVGDVQIVDKHLLLWPELFRPFELPEHDKRASAELLKSRVPAEGIQWKNYYDYGRLASISGRSAAGLQGTDGQNPSNSKTETITSLADTSCPARRTPTTGKTRMSLATSFRTSSGSLVKCSPEKSRTISLNRRKPGHGQG